MKKKVGISAIIIILLIIIGGFGTFVSFMTDYLWFKELGYTSVFFTKLFTQLKIGVPVFLIITALTYVYLSILKKGYEKKIQVEVADTATERYVRRFSMLLSAAFGVLVTLSTVSTLWMQILRFSNATDFGVADPIFNNDVGFYVHKLEFLTQLNQIGLGVIVAFFIVTLLFYFILMALKKPKFFTESEIPPYDEDEDGDKRFNGGFGGFGDIFGNTIYGNFGGRGPKRKAPKQFDKNNVEQLMTIASKQIVFMGVVFFIMIGINFYLRQFSLLYSQTGLLFGAGYTDINITLWVYRALMALSVVAAATFAVGLRKRNIKTMLIVPVIMILVSLVGGGVSMVVQGVIVAPDELNKESHYLGYNIEFTQKAYDLENISVKEFPANNTLTREDILNNMGTISNIRINDFEPANQFYNQTQSIRSYYNFNDVDVDRYMINGEYTQVFLAARELDRAGIEERQWLTEHIQYTHGYGVTLSRVDKVTASGQPDMLVDSIPPVSKVDDIVITRPEIYFGESTNDYIITNTSVEEFDYPSNDGNVYTEYGGTAGINLTLPNKILFAMREQSLKMLVSTNITSDSRIMIYRNIEERLNKIAPFLLYDSDPYIVIADGRLVWIVDAYTYSSYYPYSEPFNSRSSNVNYIRNSVKVTVDAYNGDVNFYLVDDEDPIANTLAKIYPGLLKDFSEMPESLQEHVRYPNALFAIQADVYKKYHMDDVTMFYQSEDLWAVAKEIFGTDNAVMTPTYYIMKLPGEDHVEFISSLPYTPNGKDNMTGLLMARSDGAHYGELVLYRLPKDRIIYGPHQVEAQIDQNTEISKEFSLWGQAGSEYSRGNMFVIPIEQSLMYVEPVYLAASNGSLPEVKRVIVVYNNKIAYEETLAKALDSLFGAGTGDPLLSDTPTLEAEHMVEEGADYVPENGNGGSGAAVGSQQDEVLTLKELAEKANAAFENAVSAQQRGDWSAYGRYLEELENSLRQMQEAGRDSGFAEGFADSSGNVIDPLAGNEDDPIQANPDTANVPDWLMVD